MSRSVSGWILSGLLALFLIYDASSKILLLAGPTAQAAKAGFPVDQLRGIGVTLLIVLILYLVPRTAGLGMLLLTAYLGGAVASIVVLHAPAALMSFPIVFAVLAWIAFYLRQPGSVRAMLLPHESE